MSNTILEREQQGLPRCPECHGRSWDLHRSGCSAGDKLVLPWEAKRAALDAGHAPVVFDDEDLGALSNHELALRLAVAEDTIDSRVLLEASRRLRRLDAGGEG